jgi:NAD(P)-dependent dehydrogenase (short-subunit alcohol dehydrogenase family)
MGRDNDLTGKVFAVSGGASGIGLATSQILVQRGASVAIGDIDDAALEKAKSTLGPAERLLFTKLDVGDRSSVDGWIKSAVEKFGKLSGACNSAGVIGKHHGTRAVEELEDDQWDLIMRVNLTGQCGVFACPLD